MIPQGIISGAGDLLAGIDRASLERVCECVGEESFYDAIIALIAVLVPFDMYWVISYYRQSRPVIHTHEVTAGGNSGIDRSQIRAAYDSGYFRFDPFFKHWREAATPGVYSMYDFVDSDETGDIYVKTFMPISGVEDDVAVLLKVNSEMAVGFCIERRSLFSASERARLDTVFPVLNGLIKSHHRIVRDIEKKGRDENIAPLRFRDAVSDFLPDLLTPRERQIVELVLVGCDNSFIARNLGVSVGTVRNHRKRLYVKLDITAERELFSLFLGHLANVDPTDLGTT